MSEPVQLKLQRPAVFLDPGPVCPMGQFAESCARAALSSGNFCGESQNTSHKPYVATVHLKYG